MSKQLILITAPFNCGFCTKAAKDLPSLCEEKGWEFIEMKNDSKEKEEKFPVDMYPTIMVRVNEEIKEVIRGYNPNNFKDKLKNY